MKLTATNVRSLSVPRGRSEAVFFDDDVKGFGVRVKPSGTRSYVMCWKVDGEHRRVTIGSVSDTDFGKAKNRAKDIKADVRRGDDPAGEIKTARLETANSFASLVPKFLHHLQTREDPYRPRAFKEIERHLTKHASALDKKAASRITRYDVTAVLDDVAKNAGGVTANHVRTSLSVFFGWAMRKPYCEANPVIGTEKRKEKSRERVLTPSELRLVWNAAGDGEHGSIVRLLLLTGQREGEIAGLRDSEIHDDLIILPGERTKNGRPHVVPLAPQALKIINAQDRQDGRDLLFGRGEGAFSGWSKSKERLDERIAEANDGEAIPHWTLHDLRRTFATYAGGGLPEHQFGKLSKHEKELAAGLGHPPHLIFAALNQISGYKAGIGEVYQKGSYDKEKRTLLQDWAARVDLILKSTDNVTPIRRRKA
jgi:integrase